MREIETESLQGWLAEGTPVTILDVRPVDQRQEWGIPGSLHVDAHNALRAGDVSALAAVDLPEERPVVTVCAAGNTSKIAARQLEQRGLEVFSLRGGMKAWSLAWNRAEVELPGGVRITQIRRTGKGCLSYIVSADGEALVIDPSLDAPVYQQIADDAGMRIVGVLDTHVHADHLSRGHALAQALGVPRYLPAQERVECEFRALRKGDILRFGEATLEVLHTPGHTWESSCFVLDGAVLTGDTLFLDSVGRPDLEARPEEVRERSNALHSSLEQLLSLPDETLVLPGHADRPLGFDGVPWVATIRQVRHGVRLLDLDRDAFVAHLEAHVSPAPANHHRIVLMNESCQLPHDPTELEAGANRCAVR